MQSQSHKTVIEIEDEKFLLTWGASFPLWLIFELIVIVLVPSLGFTGTADQFKTLLAVAALISLVPAALRAVNIHFVE